MYEQCEYTRFIPIKVSTDFESSKWILCISCDILWNPYEPLHVLKLVRTPFNVYFTAFKSIFLSLYAPITSD